MTGSRIITCTWLLLAALSAPVAALGGREDARGAEEAFGAFLRCLSQGEYPAAYEMLAEASRSAFSADEFVRWRTLAAQSSTLEDFTVWFRREPRDYGKPLANHTIEGRTYPKAFIASVTMRLRDRQTGLSHLRTKDSYVVKEGGGWKPLMRTGGLGPVLSTFAGGTAGTGSREPQISAGPTTCQTAATYGPATLHHIGGVPFVRLRGSYREMGVQYGVLLADRMRLAQTEMQPLLESLEKTITPSLRKSMEERLGERYMEQLRGMAEGSGLKLEKLLAGAWFGELRRLGGCSSILIDTPQALLHGRNLDDLPFSAKFPVIVEYNPDGRLPLLAMGVIGDAGISEGMNREGLSVSGNGAPGGVRHQQLLGLPYTLLRREILETCSDITQARTLLGRHEASSGTIVAVGSARERAGLVSEHLYQQRSILEMRAGGLLYATNTFSGSSMPGAKAEDTCGRCQQIRDFAKLNRPTGVDEMIYLLSLTSEPSGVNNAKTVHSVVMDAASGSVYFANESSYAAFADWYCYDWSADTWRLHRSAGSPGTYL